MLNTINLHITNKCNLRCKHCLYSSGENNMEEMTFNDIKNLIDQFFDICSGEWTINIYWWESLLRKDIFDILEYILSIWLKVWITSNMSLPNSYLEKLYNMNISRYIVNIDWAYDISHDWLRNKKWHFNKMIDIIKELKNRWKYVAINSVIHKKNLNEVINILNLCNDLNVNAISFYLFTFLWRWYSYKDLMVWPKEWVDTRNKIIEWINKNNPKFSIIWETAYSSKWKLSNLDSSLCSWKEQDVIDIACDGNVYFCWLLISVKGYSLWNVKKTPLKEILLNRKKMWIKSKVWCTALAIQEHKGNKLIDPRDSYEDIIPICPYDWEVPFSKSV